MGFSEAKRASSLDFNEHLPDLTHEIKLGHKKRCRCLSFKSLFPETICHMEDP
jgi:hypothetical protein